MLNIHENLKLNKVCQLSLSSILTAEGLTPPSAVYKASFPTGIPIPYKIKTNKQYASARSDQNHTRINHV